MERYTTRMRPLAQARANGASVEEDLPNRVVDVNVDHSVWRDVLHADDAVLVPIHDVHTQADVPVLTVFVVTVIDLM
jgi:hypothetical protein